MRDHQAAEKLGVELLKTDDLIAVDASRVKALTEMLAEAVFEYRRKNGVGALEFRLATDFLWLKLQEDGLDKLRESMK